MSFSTKVFGKWVLAGEHSVLKGFSAVAMPHSEFYLELLHEQSDARLQIQPSEINLVVEELISLFQDHTRSFVKTDFKKLTGQLQVKNFIPLGAGLGSSAAFCIALSRWLIQEYQLPEENLQQWATRLEDRFHGESSGMDVAVELAGCPVKFVRGQSVEKLNVVSLPKFRFHDTGLRANTKECVSKVMNFRTLNRVQGPKIDEIMGEASELALKGLLQQNIFWTAEAMNQAHSCFEAWGLVPDDVRKFRYSLLQQGALAVKLTGAGGGGFLVSLWK